MDEFATTMTIKTTTIIPIFITTQVRRPENGSFTTLYTRKHWNIYFLVQKTITLRIYGNTMFGVIWIALQTTQAAVYYSFGKVWYYTACSLGATSRNLLFPSHISPYDVDVDCVSFGRWFEWSNTSITHARVMDFGVKNTSIFVANEMHLLAMLSFFEFLLFLFSSHLSFFHIVLGLTNELQ